MPAIDLSILNQRQTPAFYADTLANRPAAGFVGRIFVSTNTFAFFRDNGTGWDLIGGPGTGTVTGTGTSGQVTYWNGASTVTGDSGLFYDAVNDRLGIGTITPGAALDVHSAVSGIAQLNQTVVTNNSTLNFQNSNVGLWRIGSFYNAGANDFGIFDVVGAAQPVTIKKTTGQVLIGTSTVGSGKLVVASATGDNGVQIVGATAPSLRIDNAESGPTKRAGFGIATATNNFIQGSADRDFCMFNGSTTASPILFGVYDAAAVNVQEAARISAARNFIIGTTTDGGQKLQISGTVRSTGYYLDGMTLGSGALYYSSALNRVTLANYNAGGILQFEVNSGNPAATILANENFGIGTINPTSKLHIYQSSFTNVTQKLEQSSTLGAFHIINNASTTLFVGVNNNTGTLFGGTGGAYAGCISMDSSYPLAFATSGSEKARFTPGGNLLIGTTTDAGQKLQVSGSSQFTGTLTVSSAYSFLNGLRIAGSDTGNTIYQPTGDLSISTASTNIFLKPGGTSVIITKTTGVINMPSMPTSAAGLVSGDLYRLGTVINIVP